MESKPPLFTKGRKRYSVHLTNLFISAFVCVSAFHWNRHAASKPILDRFLNQYQRLGAGVPVAEVGIL